MKGRVSLRDCFDKVHKGEPLRPVMKLECANKSQSSCVQAATRRSDIMGRLFSHPRFLVIYSAVLTVIFFVTTILNFGSRWLQPTHVSGAEQKDARDVDFDQITVHRINIVEPDGTPRLIISDKAKFPGGFYKGKEFTRKERQAAGMLFNNDEGTE